MKAVFAALVLSLLPVAANAGDSASLAIIGFSADGKVFAFEQYGVQDGSGFPYAERHYIDTATDSFLPGTPVRARIEDEQAEVSAARAKVRTDSEAATGIADAALAGQPGELLAFSPYTEIDKAPHHMAFLPRAYVPGVDLPVSVTLRPETYTAGPGCYGFHTQEQGFSLHLANPNAGNSGPRVIHDDDGVPASRGCPTDYRIGGAVAFEPADGPARLVILVAMQKLGFEGPDIRWMAVATTLDR